MKIIKNIACIIIIVIIANITCSSNILATNVKYAVVIPDGISEEYLNGDFYYDRQCDKIAGEIVEKYNSTMYKNNFDKDYIQLSISYEKENRIEAMYKMIDIYDYVNKNEKTYLKRYLQNYSPYTDDLDLINYYKTKFDNENELMFYPYEPTKSINYANQYYYNYNPAYPDLNY